MDTQVEASLKAQLDGVGKQLTTLIEDMNKSNAATKSAFENQIKKLEERQAAIEAEVAKAERLHLPGVEVGKKGETNKFSFARLSQVLSGVRKETDKDVGYEMEVCRQVKENAYDVLPVEMKTAINAASGAGGAYLISTEVYNDILPELEAASILSLLGLRSITGLTSNVAWNRDLGGITAAYIDSEAEETGSESVSTFGHMELKPHVYAAFVPLTHGMMTQPAMALEPWIRARMAYKIGLLRDLSGFTGTGASSKPIGLTAAGTQTQSWANVNTAAELIAALTSTAKKLPEANAVFPGAKLGWAAGPFTVSFLSEAFDASNRPMLWSPLNSNIQENSLRLSRIGGVQLRESTQLNAGAAETNSETFYYGDFNQGAEFSWGTLAFASSGETETNFRKLRTTIRAVGAHDFGWFQPNAFVKCTSLDTTATWA